MMMKELKLEKVNLEKVNMETEKEDESFKNIQTKIIIELNAINNISELKKLGNMRVQLLVGRLERSQRDWGNWRSDEESKASGP